MKNEKYYEVRNIIKSDKKGLNLYFDEVDNSKTLEDIIFENNKIVLLGNPGIGKSEELENLFNVLWDKIDESGIIPFSINLKNFRSVNNFEDLLAYKDWQDLPQVIFILDGLDEIAEIEDFLSAFDIFMNKYKLSNFKYVISCRTNIYEKYLVNISNFETFYLEDLSIEQSGSILENKFDIDIKTLTLLPKHYQYLKTPFFLNLFAEYYKSEAKLPDSDPIMWDAYVNTHLEIQRVKVKKKRILNIPQEIKELKKVAFVNELKQENFITNEDLNTLIGQDYVNFIENPFFVNLENEHEKFSFEHRQLQEYFVAKTLSEKSFYDIISIIRINETIQKVHPTLFNAVSFLINLLDTGNARNNLIDWIKKNQIELLLKADSDRIDLELRINIFQEYFENICINKTYWIGNDKTFSINEIAKFGDCETNFDFLIDIIKDESKLFRARISAINLISYFTIPLPKRDEFKKFLIENLKSENNTNQMKSYFADCIEKQKICKEDVNYLNQLLTIFKNETSKEINVEILGIINEFEDIDLYSDFIFEEFLRENKIKPRNEDDDVIRGTSYILNQLILKLKDSNKFIDFAKYFFDSEMNINLYSNSHYYEFIEKCVYYDKKEVDFITRLFEKIELKSDFFYFQGTLKELIGKIRKESVNNIFKYLLDSFQFDKINFALSPIANNENIYEVINKFENGIINNQTEIEHFRNAVGNNSNKKLGKLFNDEMIKKGFVFQEKFITEEDLVLIQENFQNKPQKNFNILFNKVELIEEFEKIFKKREFKITREKYYEINHEWYAKNGHGNIIDTSLEILSKLIYSFDRPVSFNDVLKQINDEDCIIKEIKSDLEKNKNNTNKIKISKSQKDFIKNWVERKIEVINFSNIVTYDSDSFSTLNDYNKWVNVIYFSIELTIEIPKDFLLNSLIIPDITNSNNKEKLFNYLKETINDLNSFNSKIQENLKQNNISFMVLDNHINYALENKLKLTYPDIKNHIINERYNYNLKDKLTEFYELEKDVDFLKKLCTNINSDKAWSAISVLIEEEFDNEREFCENIAMEYLFNNENDVNQFYISPALNILFKCNSIKAIQYYLNHINTDTSSLSYFNSFAGFNAIEDYSILSEFFKIIYTDKNKKIGFNNSATYFEHYISNLSSNDYSYKKVQKQLNLIKEELELKKNDSGIFYINLLIDKSNNSYYNFKSKKLDFKQALKRANEILV